MEVLQNLNLILEPSLFTSQSIKNKGKVKIQQQQHNACILLKYFYDCLHHQNSIKIVIKKQSLKSITI